MKRHIWILVCFLGISAYGATEEPKEAFAAILPDGTTIELVGLRNYSNRDLQQFKDRNYPWWRPDGTAIVEPPDTFKGSTSVAGSYWFVIRVREGINHNFKAVGPYGGDLTVQPTRERYKGQEFANKDLRRFTLGCGDRKSTDIRLAVATDDWKVVERWQLSERSTPYNHFFGSSEQVILRCPEQKGTDVIAEVTQTMTDQATRLVVFDRQGNQYVSYGEEGGKSVSLVRYIHRFKNFDRKNVEHVEFQSRPYEYWITFGNVSLQTGHKTQVKVEIKQPGALLRDNSLPGFDDIELDFAAENNKGRMLLICFFDVNQRPSRRCISELTKQAEQLKEKGVAVVAIQASKINQDSLDEWIKHNSVSFSVGMIAREAEKTRFTWGVRSLPWLILADRRNVVIDGGFGLSELDDKIKAAN